MITPGITGNPGKCPRSTFASSAAMSSIYPTARPPILDLHDAVDEEKGLPMRDDRFDPVAVE